MSHCKLEQEVYGLGKSKDQEACFDAGELKQRVTTAYERKS
jgi:hypothetical protein